jgi:uncharacterized protein YkwD
MTRRSKQRTALSLETLESRQVLSSAAPTSELQYALDLINLTRTNPAAAADRLTANLSASTKGTLEYYGVNLDQAKKEISAASPRQPLAWNDALAKAAQVHSDDMASNGFQSHTGSDGSSPADRIAREGYEDSIRTAENAFAYSESIDQAIQAFVIDWGVADKGHRRNILEPDNDGDDSFKEIGIGVTQSKRIGMGKVVTQNFGVRRNAPAQLLGVVYDDRDNNNFYSIGEGQGGVSLVITGANGFNKTVQTTDAGGYQIELKPGTYHVSVVNNGREIQSRDIRIGAKNVKFDVDLSDMPPAPAPAPRTVKIVTNPVATTSKAATPVVTSKPSVVVNNSVDAASSSPALSDAAANRAATVTVLSNLTTPAKTDPEPEPTPITFSNVGGFTWNTWKTIPKRS